MPALVQRVPAVPFAMDYFRFGQGPRPLVILPGLSVQSVMRSAAAVATAYERFAADYTVYLFDYRTDLPPVYRIADMADDIAVALQALDLRQVCLFGASQGGMTALTLALRHPDSVCRLAVGSSAARMDEDRAAVIREWIVLAQAGQAAALYRSFGRAVYPPAVYARALPLLEAAAQTVTADELERFCRLATASRGLDLTAELPRVACPTLVIGSRDDGVLGAAAADELAAALAGRPDCEVWMLDGYGHAAYDTAPDYKDRLYRFFMPSNGPTNR